MGVTSIQATVNCTKAVYKFLTEHIPTHWVCPSTIAKWNKNIAALSFYENQPNQNVSQFFGFGIMADETIIVVKLKDILHCNASTISS
ncbi:hypothetical protein F8M41_023584 [Gigaspora margarita]|uniref:Uncharacterized protein n=1 Tax=Gigaspora margarita TaxID=4874 RepID=A0A8H4ETH5_GIGMA|nr:hypothetical protein F8M41_023584 [Gigaspora margarita]